MLKKEQNKSQLIIYQTETGETKIDVRFQDETVWLSQQLMAELFQTTKQNISLHIANIYEEKELLPQATVKEFLTVKKEGNRQVSRNVEYYNLDMIISVGYRVKSKVATHFRQWATSHLREFIIKGFVLDDERLKNPKQPFDYFDELARRIQDIRTSERRFYQKITDIYATSVDYDPTDEMSIEFFKTVQNKMHWAITGRTAAEIIYERVDSKKKNMGLTSWRGTKIRKDDVAIAKNYLSGEELLGLNNLVEQYLVFAEGQAMRRVPMYMKDWIKKLHGFLQFNERDILTHAGRISHQLALEKAELEYEQYARDRQLVSDRKGNAFDELVNETRMIEVVSKKKRTRKPDNET
ncbi:MAG: virulence RhuM family protein [bacterium]